MRKKGCGFEYEKEFRADIMRAYRSALDSARFGEDKQSIMRRAINSPSARFWVSEYRAYHVICDMYNGHITDGMTPNNAEKYKEIYRRVREREKLHPECNRLELVFYVVNQPAPKFYLTEKSFYAIVCKTKRRWFEERKRKVLESLQQQ